MFGKIGLSTSKAEKVLTSMKFEKIVSQLKLISKWLILPKFWVQQHLSRVSCKILIKVQKLLWVRWKKWTWVRFEKHKKQPCINALNFIAVGGGFLFSFKPQVS